MAAWKMLIGFLLICMPMEMPGYSGPCSGGIGIALRIYFRMGRIGLSPKLRPRALGGGGGLASPPDSNTPSCPNHIHSESKSTSQTLLPRHQRRLIRTRNLQRSINFTTWPTQTCLRSTNLWIRNEGKSSLYLLPWIILALK